jgi:hypothetical protein
MDAQAITGASSSAAASAGANRKREREEDNEGGIRVSPTPPKKQRKAAAASGEKKPRKAPVRKPPTAVIVTSENAKSMAAEMQADASAKVLKAHDVAHALKTGELVMVRIGDRFFLVLPAAAQRVQVLLGEATASAEALVHRETLAVHGFLEVKPASAAPAEDSKQLLAAFV